MPSNKTCPVLVTTEFRGVFFGYLSEEDIQAWTTSPDLPLKLDRARCCLYWPPEQKGFLGLASEGPLDGAKVGPSANLMLAKITAIADVSVEAVIRWKAAPWS